MKSILGQEVKKLLIVDDETEVLHVLGNFFQQKGYSVLLAENSRDGVCLAKSENVDVVIIDLLFPEVDGLEHLRDLRTAFPTLPILVLTGLPLDQELDRECRAWGATECLQKTESIEYLFKIVAQFN